MVERGELDRRRPELPGLSRAPILDSPVEALNQAFAWSVRRDPAGVRADPGGEPDWGLDDFEELLETAETFRRVGPGAHLEPERFLHQIVAGLFGIRSDAAGGRFEIAPWVVPGWRSLALRRLRCHRTVLDVEVRARAEWVTVAFEHGFGPAIPLAVSLRHAGAIARVLVDEVPLDGERAVFTLQELHEVMFFFRGGP